MKNQLVAPSLAGEDRPTEFVGGVPVLMKFLASNVNYPNVAERFRLEGKVVVSFVARRQEKRNRRSGETAIDQ